MRRLKTAKSVANDYLRKYQDNPDRWIEDILGVYLWSKQKEIVRSVFENRRTVVRSCHSAGKTFSAAVVVLAFLFLKTPCKIITTAPTWYQVKDLLWSEINMLYKDHLLAMGFPGVPLKTRLNVRDNWFAMGISPKEAVNFQGFHQENVLVVFDEAPGVRSDIIEGADSLLSSGNAHALWIGNPTEPSGHFYEAFRSPRWEKIHIGYKDTPNFSGETIPRAVADRLLAPEWVEEKREDWGEDSPLFVSRVMGDFPEAGENQLISLGLCEAAKTRDVTPFGEKILGLDIARFGMDQTVYTMRQGPVITKIHSDSKLDTMEVAGRTIVLCDQNGIDKVQADEIGIGSGVVDRLREQKVRVIGINSGNSAVEPDKYFNLRAEMWFNMRDWLETGKIPDDDRLIRDLTAPRYSYTSKGQYKMESKDDTKKRLKKSPDFGDSAVLAVQNIRKANPLAGIVAQGKVKGW